MKLGVLNIILYKAFNKCVQITALTSINTFKTLSNNGTYSENNYSKKSQKGSNL